jgi:hypothetical protein
MAQRTLLVEPDPSALASLERVLIGVTDLDGCSTFSEARRLLQCHEYERLITNFRLRDFNGLHVVYLAPKQTRSIVYSNRHDRAARREVQYAGAFYESWNGLQHAILGYFQNVLPTTDRRSALTTDRRAKFRGGRRRSDVSVAIEHRDPAHETPSRFLYRVP